MINNGSKSIDENLKKKITNYFRFHYFIYLTTNKIIHRNFTESQKEILEEQKDNDLLPLLPNFDFDQCFNSLEYFIDNNAKNEQIKKAMKYVYEKKVEEKKEENEKKVEEKKEENDKKEEEKKEENEKKVEDEKKIEEKNIEAKEKINFEEMKVEQKKEEENKKEENKEIENKEIENKEEENKKEENK